MRIKITFINQQKKTNLPINTNYYLVKLINKLTYEYRRYLNALLPYDQRKRNFDLYTFSQLIIPHRKIERDQISILSHEFHWYVASPFYQFLGLLAKELRQRGNIQIAEHRFGVGKVSFISSPVFEKAEAQFTCLSPVAVYRMRVSRKQRSAFHFKNGYLLPDEGEYISYLKRDLIEKYNTLQKKRVLNHLNLELEYDPIYIKKKNNRITKVITLENGERLPEQVRGVLAPLSVKAEPDILRLIYDAGLGQLNNFGFGMVETVHARNYLN